MNLRACYRHLRGKFFSDLFHVTSCICASALAVLPEDGFFLHGASCLCHMVLQFLFPGRIFSYACECGPLDELVVNTFGAIHCYLFVISHEMDLQAIVE